MSIHEDSDSAFDRLPRFDARDFEPPAWAKGPQFQWGKKNGESSTSAHRQRQNPAGDHHVEDDGDEEDGEEEWVDASEGRSEVDPNLATFTTGELKALLAQANDLKTTGNNHFIARPPELDQALTAYKSALDHLPPCTKKPPSPVRAPATGIAEVTDDEAAAIEEEASREDTVDPEVRVREEVDEEVRECTKACWGNLGACYTSLGDDKEAANACTKALEIDPHYVKALQRRAAANERLSTWSSLTSAQDDYTTLLALLSNTSPHVLAIRRALSSLPSRIKDQQEKEKDEMLGKLKELGNGILGKFGLSTDMFKFDQQEGGGYNMRFER